MILPAIFFLALFVNLGIFVGYGYETRLFALTECVLAILFAATLLVGRVLSKKENLSQKASVMQAAAYKYSVEKTGKESKQKKNGLEGILGKEYSENPNAEQGIIKKENESDASWNQAKRILESQRELLLEKETRLYNITEALSDLSKPGKRNRTFRKHRCIGTGSRGNPAVSEGIW